MKGVLLTTAHAEPVLIKESVKEIVEQVKEKGEDGHLNYTVLNLNYEGVEYEASCLVALYRGVREMEMPEKKKGK